ncbi:hypothetical protein ACLB2K_004159 [Fragaria x ananassa]
MDDRKEKNAPWLSVPQFGDWDQKGGQVPDYSLDFSKIREMRKQNKRDVSRASLGNEEELIASNTTNVGAAHNDSHHPHYHQSTHSPTILLNALWNKDKIEKTIARRSIFSYFNCCVKA